VLGGPKQLTTLLIGPQEFDSVWHRGVGEGCLEALPVLCVLPPASKACAINFLASQGSFRSHHASLYLLSLDCLDRADKRLAYAPSVCQVCRYLSSRYLLLSELHGVGYNQID
jgi:hypothetical protein